MYDLKIEFRTLTPMWTGGAERNSNRIRETGLMGSLRWWYEGVVRGLGCHACDPVSEGQNCRLEDKEYDEAKGKGRRGARLLSEAGLCPACQLFGATGWQRRFRLEVKGMSSRPLFFVASKKVYQAAGNWLWRMFGGEATGGAKVGRGADVTFTFGVQALWGETATMHIVPLGSDAEGTCARVAFLVNTAARCGGIGSKTQNGFGQVEIVKGLERDLIRKGRDLVVDDVEKSREVCPRRDDEMFSLADFFSRTYELAATKSYCSQLRDIGATRPDEYAKYYIPCSFDIRYKSRSRNPFTGQGHDFGMRPWFRRRWGKESAGQIFGRSDARSDDERAAGRIRVSHLYRAQPDMPWRVKVWGHVPRKVESEDRKRQGLIAVARDLDEFIRGKNGMFPGSRLVEEYKREEVLGK